MKKITLLSMTCLLTISAYSKEATVIYTYKENNGSTLLSNRPATDDKQLTLVKAEKRIPTTETVHVKAHDVYKSGWCKIGNAFALCYKYQNTVPAYSYTEPGSKAIRLNEKQIQESIEQYKQEQQDIAEQKNL